MTLRAAPTAGCDPLTSFVECSGHTETDGHGVAGYLIVAEAPEVTKLSVANGHGCADCRWTVTAVCRDDTTTTNGECVGEAAGCPPGELRFAVQLATATEPLHLVSSYCHGGPGDGTLSPAQIAPDVRRYAEQVRVTAPAVATYPPNDETLVNLPTYFAAQSQPTAAATVGGQGYSLQIQLAASQFTWTFGDGETVTTTDPGGPPPGGTVRHTYARTGTVPVAVTVAYGATYSIVTPFGTIGPQAVDGGPVQTVPAAANLQVREAYAGLTS